MTAHGWLADLVAQRAAARLARSHPEWAQAILHERATIVDQAERLHWALGTVRTSLSVASHDLLYPSSLVLAMGVIVSYQWSADENLITLLLLSGLAATLGLFRPERVWVTGVAVGLVVSAVTGFEWLSGVQPHYEVVPRTLWNCVHWSVFVVPATLCAFAGRQLRLKLNKFTAQVP